MIKSGDKSIECAVVVSRADGSTGIRRTEAGFEFCKIDEDGGDGYVIEFAHMGEAVATTRQSSDLPKIGLDFLWTFFRRPAIASVIVHLDEEGNAKIRNGHVVVSKAQNIFSETDVIEILEEVLKCGDIAEAKSRIKEVLEWKKRI